MMLVTPTAQTPMPEPRLMKPAPSSLNIRPLIEAISR